MKVQLGGPIVGALAMLALFWLLQLVGVLDFGAADRAAAAQLRAALAAQADSAAAWHHRAIARDSALVALRADSADRAGELAIAHAAAQAGLVTIRQLLAQLPDSSRIPIAAAVQHLGAEAEGCRAGLGNCEQRVQVQAARASDAEAQLRATAALLDTTSHRWTDAERRASPSLFRDLWRSKQVVLPLALLVVLLSLRR